MLRVALIQTTTPASQTSALAHTAPLIEEAVAGGATFIATPEGSTLLQRDRAQFVEAATSAEADPFVTGVREMLYQSALPRSTRHLEVTTSRLGAQSAVAGGHAMVVDQVYAPAAVDAELARTMPAAVSATR